MSGFTLPSSFSRSIFSLGVSVTTVSRSPVAVPVPVVVVVSVPGVTVVWVMVVEPSGFFSTVGGVLSLIGSAPGLGFVSTLVSDFSVFSAVPITTSSGFFSLVSVSPLPGLGSVSPLSGLGLGLVSPEPGLGLGLVSPLSGLGLGSVSPLSGLGLGSVSPLSGLGLGLVSPPVSPEPGLGLVSPLPSGLVTITPSSFWEPSGLVVGLSLLYLTSASFRVSQAFFAS